MLRNITQRRLIGSLVLVSGAALSGACETGGQTGALAGAGIGALAGAAIGGNGTGALIGAGVGTGIGYIVGNESDKAEAKKMSQSTKDRDYKHTEDTLPLSGTRWKVTGISPKDAAGEWDSILVEFKRHGHVVTTYTRPGGKIEEHTENYRVVGDTLIINESGYLVNARFRIEGTTLYAEVDSSDMGDYSLIMERL